MTERKQIEIVNRSAFDVRESQDYDRILHAIGDAHIVLIGEAAWTRTRIRKLMRRRLVARIS